MTTGERFPATCTHMDADGQLPTCIQNSDGTWDAVYPSPGPGGGAVVALFLLGLVVAVAFTIWKVSTARRMARESGMSEGDATAMALLTDDGFEATYLASNVRGRAVDRRPAGPTGPGTAAERLAELRGLLDQGLVSQQEHDAARGRILDGL